MNVIIALFILLVIYLSISTFNQRNKNYKDFEDHQFLVKAYDYLALYGRSGKFKYFQANKRYLYLNNQKVFYFVVWYERKECCDIEKPIPQSILIEYARSGFPIPYISQSEKVSLKYSF